MTAPAQIPDDYVLARTTEVFDRDTVPAGLVRAHRVADGIWGRLIVHTGTVRFMFEDVPEEPVDVGPGGSVVIPPSRLHHVAPDGSARFAVEFYRAAASGDDPAEDPAEDPADDPADGRESTGLA